MTRSEIDQRIERLEGLLRARPRLRLRVCCPSQEFSLLEMEHGTGHWLSCVRSLWESLSVATEPDLALVMLQAPRVPASVIQHLLRLHPATDSVLRDRHDRHVLIDLDDASERHLSEKFLARPLLLRRIRSVVALARHRGHIVERLSCYQSSARMDELAEALGLDSAETPSRTLALGTKAGSRRVFRDARIPHPPGTYEATRDMSTLADRLAGLTSHHGSGRWLVKINEGCGSGHGNALVDLAGADPAEIRARLHQRLRPLAADISRAEYLRGVAEHGAIVEKFLDGPATGLTRSPSALLLIHRGVRLLATHDQELGDASEVVGCRFPADSAYRETVIGLSRRVAELLLDAGVRGHVGVDFVAHRPTGAPWEIHATEINLRQTGTTHPHRTVRALVPGTWHDDSRLTRGGAEICYTATDRLLSDTYRGITPERLIHRLERHPGVSFDFRRASGVIPHYWTALEPFGRIGATFIHTSQEGCDSLREQFTGLLNELSRRPEERTRKS
ncbi:hypothetical protein [Actinomadura sp. 3N508]|uniref:hypothetical protein n=1 Tax=Actinomadura sp. 3N508 TaxID=3375153 RepID=UPI0037902D32